MRKHWLRHSIFCAVVCAMAIGNASAQAPGAPPKYTVKLGMNPGHFNWRGPKDTDGHEAAPLVTPISEVPVNDLATLQAVLAARQTEQLAANALFLAAYTEGAAKYAASHTSHSSDHYVHGAVDHNHRHSGTVQLRNGQQCGTMNSCAYGCGESWPVYYENGRYRYTCRNTGRTVWSNSSSWNNTRWNYRYNSYWRSSYRYNTFYAR